VRVDGEQPHCWQARIPRALAHLHLVDRAEDATGAGYHDTNHGSERLGRALPGWRWTRVHGPDATWVRYRPATAVPALELAATCGDTVLRSVEAGAEALRRSRWALPLPRRLAAGPADLPARAVLESSPFYARLEGAEDGVHALGEVADFRRFHSPLVRWMAHFRLRVERAA
jgi:carotenoid 1,2-hydratase